MTDNYRSNTNPNLIEQITREMRVLANAIVELKEVVLEIKSKQDTLDERLDLLLPPATEDPQQEFSYSILNTIPLNAYLKDEIKTAILSKPNRLDKNRNIGFLGKVMPGNPDCTDDDANEGHPTTTRRRNIHQRLQRLIHIMYDRQYGANASQILMKEELEALKEPFQRLAKEVAQLIISNQNDNSVCNWGDVPSNEQDYYCLVMEDAAFKRLAFKGLHLCEKSWACRAYLSLAFKARSQKLKPAASQGADNTPPMTRKIVLSGFQEGQGDASGTSLDGDNDEDSCASDVGRASPESLQEDDGSTSPEEVSVPAPYKASKRKSGKGPSKQTRRRKVAKTGPSSKQVQASSSATSPSLSPQPRLLRSKRIIKRDKEDEV